MDHALTWQAKMLYCMRAQDSWPFMRWHARAQAK